MKKSVFLFLIAVLLVNGAAWGINESNPSGITDTTLSNGQDDNGFKAGDLFDVFDVVPTASTESRYSAGRYSSYVDDFVGVNDYDPEIGTFFFLGGFPAAIPDDEYVDGDVFSNVNKQFLGDTMLNFGFAKTFHFGYLGVYYGGHLVDSAGFSRKAIGDQKASSVSRAQWENNLAVLFGTKGLGAFRLDFKTNIDTENGKYDGKKTGADSIEIANTNVGNETKNPVAIGLSWGGIPLAGFDPYVKLGIGFPEKIVWADSEGKTLTWVGSTVVALQAGASHPLAGNANVSFDLGLAAGFKETLKGKRDLVSGTGIMVPSLPTPPDNVNYAGGGAFGMALKASYDKTWEAGKLGFKVKPSLAMGFYVDSNDISGDKDEKYPALNYWNLNIGVNAGLKYQLTQKAALYTGASLQIFDWYALGIKGGEEVSGYDNRKDEKAWELHGIKWTGKQFTNDNGLGLGLTINPTENITVGFGIDQILDSFFTIDLVNMKVNAGSLFNNGAGAASGSELEYLFKNLFGDFKFDLTVAFRFK